MLVRRWLAEKTGRTENLVGAKAKLKSFNARRKLKAGMQTVRTAVRMKMLLAGVHAARAESARSRGNDGEESKSNPAS